MTVQAKPSPSTRTISAVLVLLMAVSVASAGSPPFPGQKSSFHSYDRYDFAYEGRPCIVVTPKSVAPGRPWIWRARFFGHEPQTDAALLDNGFHVAYIDVAGLFGAPKAVAIWDRFYAYLTQTHSFGKKPALEGMSRGGLIIYNWAAKNPDKVACIYADAPVCDIKSWPGNQGTGPGSASDWAQCLDAYGMTEEQALTAKCNPIDRLEPLAKAHIPLLHIVGDADEVVPVAENTTILEQRYKALGGAIQVIHKPGIGHHPHSLKDPAPIVAFVLEHTAAATASEGSAQEPNLITFARIDKAWTHAQGAGTKVAVLDWLVDMSPAAAGKYVEPTSLVPGQEIGSNKPWHMMYASPCPCQETKKRSALSRALLVLIP